MEKLEEGSRRLGLELTADQVRQFEAYYDSLVRWNRRVNLTGITDRDEAQVRHFVDSLTVTLALEGAPWAGDGFALLDVGTGAGMPGIPLKVVYPRARLVLLDSVAKKTAFLREVVGELGLEGVEVVTRRAEELAHLARYRESFDLVVCRAVGSLATVAELMLPFCRKGGLAVVHKKGDMERELGQAEAAANVLGGRLRGVREVNIEGLEQHVLVVLEKTAATPAAYPRRTGMPAKRPLGAPGAAMRPIR